jgi:hypothetical protein
MPELNDSGIDEVELAVLLRDRRLNTELRLLECDIYLCSDDCIDPWMGSPKLWAIQGSEIEVSDSEPVAVSSDIPERSDALLL